MKRPYVTRLQTNVVLAVLLCLSMSFLFVDLVLAETKVFGTPFGNTTITTWRDPGPAEYVGQSFGNTAGQHARIGAHMRLVSSGGSGCPGWCVKRDSNASLPNATNSPQARIPSLYQGIFVTRHEFMKYSPNSYYGYTSHTGQQSSYACWAITGNPC